MILFSLTAWLISKSGQPTLPSGLSQASQVQPEKNLTPFSISALREREYLGSEIKLEEKLASGANYNRYLASYQSDGMKIRGLLTVPQGPKPEKGWPAIIFNHGYIPPNEYRTLERYVAYVNGFALNGYIVFKIDYRGHDRSEGEPVSGHFAPDYTVDVLNAVASMKKFTEANPDEIGMWGHSMGGGLTLRSMVVSPEIKAAVIWAGVVGTYEDFVRYQDRIPWLSSELSQISPGPSWEEILDKYGQPNEGSDFWQEISAYTFLDNLSGPIQLHHGLADSDVPFEFSESLEQALQEKNKAVELYTYPGGDHNLSNPSFSQAMQRSVEFFDRYLKNG